MADVSAKNSKKRWPLPVFTSGATCRRMQDGVDYPPQPTSWSGMYHVLQRYGGLVALRRFTSTFDAHGMYTPAR